MTAMSPNTSGSRVVIPCTLSRLICAMPAIWTDRPAGPGTACSRSSWVSEACENSGAVLATVKNALPSAIPVGAVGGPTRLPADERPGRGRHGRDVGHPGQVGRVAAEVGRTHPSDVRDDDGHRGRRVIGEIVAQLVTNCMRRRRRRQHPVVGHPPLHPEERKPQHQQQRDDRQPDRAPLVA